MRRLAPFLLLGLGLLPLSASAQSSDPVPAAPCATLDDCIGQVLASARTRRQIAEDAIARLIAYGEPAVDRLMPLLMHPDLYVRESAGLALQAFRRIDPRHLPALVEAWRHGDIVNRRGRGNGWLPMPIAATGTDEALRLLWADMLRDPEQGSNSQVFFALARFGERLRPLAHAQLQSCAEEWTRTCNGVISLFLELDGRFPRPAPPVMPQWAIDELVALVEGQSPAPDAAVDMLAAMRHPAALPPLQRALRDLPAGHASPGWSSESEWDARMLIGSIASYGEAARASGPAIARYLDPRMDAELRAEAALAIGQIGDRSSIAAVLSAAQNLEDDWLLAYDVAESLGRLRAEEARPLLERLRGEHWHRGVRNNAARALNMIAGGAFARPDVSGDGRPYPDPRNDQGEEYLYLGHLRYAGDDAPRDCVGVPRGTLRLEQDPAGPIRWPRRGIARLEVEPPAQASERALRDMVSEDLARGIAVAQMPTRSGRLIAFNGGEFGGGLVAVPDRGTVSLLFGNQVEAMWRMGGRLYVATGLNHLFSDSGAVYIIDPERLRVERGIRLPASPIRFAATASRAVIISTAQGDIAIREDGSLADPQALGACEQAPSELPPGS
jgi:hypothetical protein